MPRRSIFILALAVAASAAEPDLSRESIFAPEPWHNHSPSIVEFPSGELFAVWFHGSGERKADDVQVLGARRAPGAASWSAPFVVADYPGFPDTNCVLFVDRHERLWLFWMTFLANEVETTVVNFRVSSRYEGLAGPPVWERQELLLLRPDLEAFERKVRSAVAPALAAAPAERVDYLLGLLADVRNKYKTRTGWMVRAPPVQLPSGRIVLGLYSDVFDFSLAALSDDDGATWRASEPIAGFGGVQPSFVARREGALVALMRDNGPAPKRIQRAESRDGGETWGPVTDTDLPNPGASVAALTLPGGEWLLVYNDLEQGRHSLVAAVSADEGRTWSEPRAVERGQAGVDAFHYPTAILARDGSIRLVYSAFGAAGKTIRYARFDPAWLPAAR